MELWIFRGDRIYRINRMSGTRAGRDSGFRIQE
jgi:hypothetical protein